MGAHDCVIGVVDDEDELSARQRAVLERERTAGRSAPACDPRSAGAERHEADALDRDLYGEVVVFSENVVPAPAYKHPFLVTCDWGVGLKYGALAGVWLADEEPAVMPRAMVRRLLDASELTAREREVLTLGGVVRPCGPFLTKANICSYADEATSGYTD